MPRCPQCGKESKSLYITSSGVCPECNRKNYQSKEAASNTEIPIMTDNRSFEERYRSEVESAQVLSVQTANLAPDEIDKLVNLQIAVLLKKVHKILFTILVAIPIALFVVNFILNAMSYPFMR